MTGDPPSKGQPAGSPPQSPTPTPSGGLQPSGASGSKKPPAEFKVPGSLTIVRQVVREGPSPQWTMWRPHTSQAVAGNDPETFSAILKFAKWPAKTPTGERLRDWLVEWGHVRRTRANLPKIDPEVVATGFGPEAHLDETDPNHNTRMIT